MNRRLLATVLLLVPGPAFADWPHWLGANRDGKTTDFKIPATWPKELKKGWSVAVGDGVATPALVGDKLYTFGGQGGEEIIRCLKADTGEEVWKDKYAARSASGPASGFPTARSSPAVADGVVVTLGVQGTLSALDAATGKKLWRKDSTGPVPGFAVASSPLIVDGLCLSQFGGGGKGKGSTGGIAAYDLKTGEQKWKWDGEGAAYASLVLITVDGVKAVVAETAGSIVAVSMSGKKLWSTPFSVRYNASTPMAVGQTLIYSGSGRGTFAVKLEKKGDDLTATDLWTNKDDAAIYNTPILKDGFVYGLAPDDSMFCLDAKTGTSAWKTKLKGPGGRNGGYGAIVDAGTALFTINPGGELVAFAPGGKEYKELARYKVASGGTYAFPILTGNKVFIRDKTNLTLHTFE